MRILKTGGKPSQDRHLLGSTFCRDISKNAKSRVPPSAPISTIPSPDKPERVALSQAAIGTFKSNSGDAPGRLSIVPPCAARSLDRHSIHVHHLSAKPS